MKAMIITGVSRGLGEALAKLGLENRWLVVGISRSMPKWASEYPGTFFPFPFDLENASEIPSLMNRILETLSPKGLSSLCLVNNAATLNPIGMVETLDPSQLSSHFATNLLAPMNLTSSFLNLTTALCPRTVVMVSSGAGIRPKAGWGAYCSSKAALEMFVKVASKEQELLSDPAKIISFDPGVMDTGMQEKIRNQDPETFPDVDRFRDLRNQGKLQDPAVVAKDLFRILGSE